MIGISIRLFLVILIISTNVGANPIPKKEIPKEMPAETPAGVESLHPYQGSPPAIELTSAQKEQLTKGRPVYFPVVGKKNSGSAIAVFKVNAPAELIWEVISRFDQYPNWVDGVKKTTYYKPADGDHVYVQFTVGKFFTPSYTYHIIHNFPKLKSGWGTWFLDTNLPNDLLNCRGFWRVTPTIENPNKSIVEYSVDLKGKGFMMELVGPVLLKNGARNATSWVSKQAESLFAKHVLLSQKAPAKNGTPEPVIN
jgi:Polyketide cyclase / dehydrase and lipid transport